MEESKDIDPTPGPDAAVAYLENERQRLKEELANFCKQPTERGISELFTLLGLTIEFAQYSVALMNTTGATIVT
ncbi:uncharacterized protein N7446_010546 [Penicillium canescens]|uniref:Uncharacterized protein n=1 Tax=Penicillium canescens TaxID=5083 RepID=A0AAD6ICH5_PENCN|nr:uncharacterized protein N7446_010546 [Penicillium canescens]KAJ6041571.1 hypothetical protein N7460_006961 [Penicillium canescens]KAJ6050437.1 hypothetical protein N7446_010546 [Penicillium canescens]KAJ6064740.1 hypothetical protein N7444_000393 [Penicillium canescens]